RTADRREDMRAVGEHRARLREVPTAQIFEHHGEEVRQLARGELEPGPVIELLELDHGVAAIAAFAVQMLEEVERQRAPAIEQVDVAFLGREQFAAAELVDELEELAALARRDERARGDDAGDLR